MTQGLNEEEILQILKIVDETKVEELCLEIGNQKLVIKKHSDISTLVSTSSTESRPAAVKFQPALSTEKAKPQNPEQQLAAKQDRTPAEPGLVPVKAPVLGIFYRAPSPGAKPYVQEGSKVTEDDIVCMIEVMKVFNAVAAGVGGTIVKVCVENGETVGYGETLFLIRPGGKVK